MNKPNLKITFWILAVFFTVGMFPNNAPAQDYARATRPPPSIPRKPTQPPPYNPRNPRMEQERPVIRVAENTVVPPRTIYFIYDEAGTRLLQTFTSGQRVILFAKKKKKEAPTQPPHVDCAKINCPETFRNADCWDCR
jgi:hypothetical protein